MSGALTSYKLLPLMPALLFSRLQRHRTGRPPSPPGPLRPWVVPSLFVGFFASLLLLL